MDEYIDIVTIEGKPTGKQTLKSIVHQKGYYHHTAQIWFYTENKEILLSQRAAKKQICPLMWDVSVAGHIDAGETVTQAAIRETKEELGFDILKHKLTKIGVFKCFQSYNNGIIDNEFHNVFIAQLNLPISKLLLQEDEVEAVKLVSFKQFQILIDCINNNNNHFIPSTKSYYQFVLKTIQKKIS